MKEKHPIDSFFKDKLANRQYPMKEEYWASAGALIETNSARKRRKFLWFFLFLGLLSGSTLIGYFTYQNRETTSTEKVLVQDFIAHKTEDKPLYVENSPKKESGIVAAHQPLETAVSKPDNKSDIKPKKVLGKRDNKIGKQNKSKKTGDSALEVLDQVLSDNTVLSQEERALGNSSIEEIETATQANKRVLGLGSKEVTIGLSKEDKGVFEKAVSPDLKSQRVAAQFLNEKSLYLSDLSIKQDQSFVPPFLAMNRRHSLGLEFGFAIHDAMGSKLEQQQSIGMSPIMGLGYRFQLNRNLSLLSGVRYTQTPSLAGDSTYLSTTFSFGETIQGTRIRPLVLHQLEVPLSLRWQAGTRSSIALGGYMRYLINVQSEVSRFESNPFETAPGPVNKAWGYKQGFEKIDLGLQLGYYYQLSEGLHLGVEAQYGLRDLRGDSFYRETHFDRNLNARLVLRYDFMRF